LIQVQNKWLQMLLYRHTRKQLSGEHSGYVSVDTCEATAEVCSTQGTDP